MLGIISMKKVFQNEVIYFPEFRELLCIVRCVQIKEYFKKMSISTILRGLFSDKNDF